MKEALGKMCSAGLRPLTRVGAGTLMRPSLFSLAWTFVTAVSAFDAYFAWRYRELFQEWELNPLARALAHSHGLAAVLTVKAAVTLFALSVALYCRHRQRLDAFYTLTVCGLHLLLGFHYLAGYLQNPCH
jgi:hypothetical protein